MYNTSIEYNKETDMSKYTCEVSGCQNKVSASSWHRGNHKCPACLTEAKRQDRIKLEKSNVESCGYEVIDMWVDDKTGTINCEVKCDKCGKVKTTMAHSITKKKRKCSCEIYASIEDLVTSIDTESERLNHKVPEEFKKIGVYAIEIGDKMYIGSSVNMQRRLNKHLRDIKKGRHTLPMMYTVAVEGINKLTYRILDTANNEDEVRELEQKYIDMYKPELNVLLDVRSCKRLDNNLESVGITSRTTDKKAAEALLLLLQHNIDTVVEKTGLTYHVVAGISNGDTYRWLESIYPTEYRRVTMKNMRIPYNIIRDILALSITDMKIEEIANMLGVKRSTVEQVRVCRTGYIQDLRAEDEEIGGLYRLNDIKKERVV